MEQLLNLLEKVNDDSVKGQAFNVFKEIATKLMSEYAIKKGGDLYQMVEIEFYWYSPNHPDLSVYPRKSAAGNWFLHPSGVDITLESCVNEDISMLQLRKEWENAKKDQENQNVVYSKSSYGGILIRTLRKFKKGDSEGQDSFIVGPWNCSDILFDYLPCDGNEAELKKMIPVIEPIKPNEMMKNNLSTDFVKEALRSGIEKQHTVKYHDKPYCFYVNKEYVKGWADGSFPNKPWNKRTQDLKLYNNV